MGGFGSGRHSYSSKSVTSDYLRLDVRYLQRHGYLAPDRFFSLWWSRNGERYASISGRSEPGQVRLIYRHRSYGNEAWNDENYPVLVDWMACNYGGARAWFRCPARNCCRRVAVLYG